jgi:uncharacterized membrane protein YeaQ/YmgE (transglycosylase-associated protein family)
MFHALINLREMTMLGLIVSLLIIGLIAGAIARLVVPGKQDLSILATIVLGIVGSFVGGFLGYLLFRSDRADGFFQPAGIFGSIIGSIIVLLLWIRFGDRSRTRA